MINEFGLTVFESVSEGFPYDMCTLTRPFENVPSVTNADSSVCCHLTSHLRIEMSSCTVSASLAVRNIRNFQKWFMRLDLFDYNQVSERELNDTNKTIRRQVLGLNASPKTGKAKN